MIVRGRMRAIKALSEFIEERIQIELPQSGVKARELKLLHEISICVFKIMHHMRQHPHGPGTIADRK